MKEIKFMECTKQRTNLNPKSWYSIWRHFPLFGDIFPDLADYTLGYGKGKT